MDTPIEFTPFAVSVVPHIANIPKIGMPGDAPGAPVEADTPDGVPPVAPAMDFGGDYAENFGEQPEEFSMQDAEDFSEMIWNMPAMFMGEHLEPDPAKLKKFARELHKYCSKKGIDPSEYMFDELPLMMVGGTMGLSMWKAHKDHKRGGSYHEESRTPEPERDNRVLDTPIKTKNDDGMIQGERQVYTEKEKSPKKETTEYVPDDYQPDMMVDMGDGAEELELARL